MTSKQRSYLMKLAHDIDPIFQIGKASVTDEMIEAVNEALEARELIKLHILKNCFEDGRDLAYQLAEGSDAEVVQVIGKKIVLYRQARDPKKRKIVLPV